MTKSEDSPEVTITGPDRAMLLGVLADVDALFEPIRSWSIRNPANAAIAERREDFRRLGIQSQGGGAMATRQSHSRTLVDLEARGLVLITRHNRSPYLRLTEAAEDHLRAIAGLPLAIDSLRLIRLIVKLTDAGVTNTGFVCETAILGRDYDKLKSPDLVRLENNMIPLLARDLLRSASDSAGRVGYLVTPRGRLFAKQRRRKDQASLDLGYDDAAARLYDQLMANARAERCMWIPENSHEVAIPLSGGMWPRDPGAAEPIAP